MLGLLHHLYFAYQSCRAVNTLNFNIMRWKFDLYCLTSGKHQTGGRDRWGSGVGWLDGHEEGHFDYRVVDDVVDGVISQGLNCK